MKIKKLKIKFYIFWIIVLFAMPVNSEEKKVLENNHEFNFLSTKIFILLAKSESES